MDVLKNIIESKNYEKIEGWCTPEKALKIANLITDNSLKVCVELGVFGGRSLLPIALAAGLDAKVTGIDAWAPSASLEGINSKENDAWWAKINYEEIYNYCKSLFLEYGLNNVTLIRKKSNETAEIFNDKSIDLLHQDSNHSEEISCEEVNLYFNKVKIGGFWIFDDTNWETTKKAQDLLVFKGYLEIFDFGSWKIYKRL